MIFDWLEVVGGDLGIAPPAAISVWSLINFSV